jgi:nitronate monooxygenase
MGADLAYVGSAFIATEEANATTAYKDAIVAGVAEDIVSSDLFTGVHGNYLRASIIASGLDPDNLPKSETGTVVTLDGAKAWRDIWGSGQGIGAVTAVEPVAARVATLKAQYAAAKAELLGKIG